MQKLVACVDTCTKYDTSMIRCLRGLSTAHDGDVTDATDDDNDIWRIINDN